MKIIEISTENEYTIEITPVEINDYRVLTKERFFFDWKIEKQKEVYKLKIEDSSDILGLISVERIPTEWRIHIRLLTVSVENKGVNKTYDRIAGNLITHIAKIAIREYGELACVSLKPKNAIAQHYIDKYNMNITGITLSIELPEILELIKTYDND